MKTDPRFWDCECPENYIHPKSEASCLECNANSDDQPDTMIADLYRIDYRFRDPSGRFLN